MVLMFWLVTGLRECASLGVLFDDGRNLRLSLKPVGECEGIYTFCYGRKFVPFPEIVFSIKLEVLQALLSFEKLALLDFGREAKLLEALPVSRYIKAITERLFGSQLFQLENLGENETKVILNEKFSQVHLWNLQLEYLVLLTKAGMYNLERDVMDVSVPFLR